MEQFDPIEIWLNDIAHERNNRSLHTRHAYRKNLLDFCAFAGEDLDQILAKYDKTINERQLAREYMRKVKVWISHLQQQGYLPSTINTKVAAVKSFLRHNDCRLGHIANARQMVVFHNRDMEKEEIVEVLKLARSRDRAFFVFMAQSGLRPDTICHLKINHAEKIMDENTPIPCLVTVPQNLTKGHYSKYFTFLGEDAVQHLKDYLKTRTNLSDDSWLFTKITTENEPLSRDSITHSFGAIVKRLKRSAVLKFEKKEKGKPAEIRLYNLRKFFRKYAGNAGSDYANYWMGHSLGVDNHYFSTDIELHRKKYRENAMPHLRLETSTPSETDKVIAKQSEEIEKLKKQLAENTGIRQALTGLEAKYVELLKRLERMEKQQS